MVAPTECKVLCVSYYFPPTSTSGTHRSRALVRHLPSFGWQPIVIAAEVPELPLDHSLLNGLPEDLKVYRIRSKDPVAWASGIRRRYNRIARRRLRSQQRPGNSNNSLHAESAHGAAEWASRWLQLPDKEIGWLPSALRVALQSIRRHKCHAIYTSAPPWTAHLVGLLAKRFTGLPWTADFRDPWRGNPFRRIPFMTLDRVDSGLEAMVVGSADRIICNSEQVCQDFARRFPLDAGKLEVIPNGFDPEDYVNVEPTRSVDDRYLVLTHAGSLYGPRRPDALFQALSLLRDQGFLSKKPYLQLLGSLTCDGESLQDIANAQHVDEMVRLRGELPHDEALRLMRGSDILVLIGFAGPGSELQVPAKLFEYMGLGRPVLALAPKQSAITEVLGASGIPAEICSPDEPAEIAAAIIRLSNLPAFDRVPPKCFHRRELVGRIAALLGRPFHEDERKQRARACPAAAAL